MKGRALFLVWITVLVVVGTLPAALPAGAQEVLPYDRSAIFRTHVPHLNSRISRGGTSVSGAVNTTSPATFSGSSYLVGATVNATTTFPAAEEHIAVDPNNASWLVAAISDFSQRMGFNTTKYAFSLDNGATWSEQFVPFDPDSLALMTSDGEVWDANSDPVVAIDKQGNVYLADLYFDALVITNGLYVSVGTLSNGGVSFSATLPVATNPTFFPQYTEDKPWLTVDNSDNPATTGNVYASWTRFVGNSLFGFTSDMIVLSRSLNHGLTWTAPIQVSLPQQNGAVQGSQVAVGPNGEVYVAYEVFYRGGKRQHFLAKSTDGGQSFSQPVAITPIFNDLRFNSTYRKNSFASLAVNPATGFVYVAYADQPKNSVGAEIEFIRSTTAGGTNFTKPVVINDKPVGQQFFPAITADSSGRIHVSWFDTRNSSTSSLYDVYATFSLDGLSFSPNARITTALIDAGSASFIGDYMGIAADGSFAHPVWTNGGFNNGLMQTATLQLP